MTYRNKDLRQLVASLPCQSCGMVGMTQAAHRNAFKGLGLKTSDAWVAALCVSCHSELDQGKDMSRQERRDLWNQAYADTMRVLIESRGVELARVLR